MRFRLMASYRGAPYEVGLGPAESDVVLFAALPPPEELGFEPATGHWRKRVIRAEVDALWESRPVGIFRGEPCLVLDDLGNRLHITYLGTEAPRARGPGPGLRAGGPRRVGVADAARGGDLAHRGKGRAAPALDPASGRDTVRTVLSLWHGALARLAGSRAAARWRARDGRRPWPPQRRSRSARRAVERVRFPRPGHWVGRAAG